MGKKISKELREWIILLGVVGILFWTGWYKDVASLLQRGLLETGLISASLNDEPRPADYDFILTDLEGNKVPFESFKGRTVFINFWATWCPPCIAEMPDIHELYEKIGGEVSFVMISVDDSPEKAREFIDKKAFEFPVYLLATSIPEAYETRTIPTTYVVSPDGNIVLEEKGLAKYDTDRIREFLLRLNESKMTP